MKHRFNSLQEAASFLHSFIPNSTTYIADGLTLDRMWPMLEAADNPHEKLKVVHIAGTSGKTSTSYYVERILRNSGKKTGLTVSPHTSSINERIQINGVPISAEEFCHELSEFMELIDEDEKPSYFELLMVFVMWVFVRKGVDYAVLETGLGGILDSTNVVTRKDKVCIITDIGFDHMEVLGREIESIAAQKAGIVHEGNHMFTYMQGDAVMAVFSDRVSSKNANMYVVQDVEFEDNNVPLFQQRNFNLAFQACEYIAQRDCFTISTNNIDMNVPGRMEVLELDDSVLVLDGGHNAQKISSLVNSIKAMFPDEKFEVVMAIRTSKEYEEAVETLKPIATSITFTDFSDTQDFVGVAHDPKQLAQFANSLGIESNVVMGSKEALEKLVQSKSKFKLVVGSFYLLSELSIQLDSLRSNQ